MLLIRGVTTLRTPWTMSVCASSIITVLECIALIRARHAVAFNILLLLTILFNYKLPNSFKTAQNLAVSAVCYHFADIGLIINLI